MPLDREPGTTLEGASRSASQPRRLARADALAEAPEGEPLDLEVELGGVPREVAHWLNPLVLRVLRCE